MSVLPASPALAIVSPLPARLVYSQQLRDAAQWRSVRVSTTPVRRHRTVAARRQVSGSGVGMSKPPGWDAIHNYKFPTLRVARLTLFWASNCQSDPSADLVLKARTLLKQHNLD